MSVQSVHAFAEKVALISDIAGPVGRAAAMQLALNGAFVIGGYSTGSEDAASAIDEMVKLGTLASAVSAKITEKNGAAELVTAVESSFGRLDILVNCLNFEPESTFELINAADHELTGNFRAAYLLTQAAMPLLAGRPKPRIVNVSYRRAVGNQALFDADQAAIDGFTRSLSRTLDGKFRVNGVAMNATPANENELFPLGKDAGASAAARTILYLLSPEAAAVRGQIIEVAQ